MGGGHFSLSLLPYCSCREIFGLVLLNNFNASQQQPFLFIVVLVWYAALYLPS